MKDLTQLEDTFKTYFGIGTKVQQEGNNHFLVKVEGVTILSSLAQAENATGLQFVCGTGRTMLWRVK